MLNARLASAACLAALLASSALCAVQAALPMTQEGQSVPTLAPLLEEVTPAVVNIAVTAHVEAGVNPLMRDPLFRKFFNLPERVPPRTRQSAGSGVIVDADKGFVLTNNHVVDGADEIVITLKDQRSFNAELVGTDPGTDIALLKIKPDRLTAVELGDSDELDVGDFVVAIGNPFGLGQTVTSGIVSALGRSGLNIEGYEDFIQTDASINPGNSGGALVDLHGKLVGINTAIIGPGGGNVGIGFAVPSNMARAVMGQLAHYGEVRRGRLGIGIQNLSPELADALKVDGTGGAVITQVEHGSAAARAGLRAGDVVKSVNRREVRSAADFRNRIGLVPVGDEVEMLIVRDGKSMTVRARISEPDTAAAAASPEVPALAGATFSNLEAGMPRYGQVEGVVLSEIEPGSPAHRHGLRRGDIIVAVNRERIRSIDDLKKVLAAPRRVLALNVLRGDAQLFIVIQ